VRSKTSGTRAAPSVWSSTRPDDAFSSAHVPDSARALHNQEALNDLTKGRAELAPALRKLKGAYADRAWTNDQAREYAQHGLCRRLLIKVHMVETVFELLPPKSSGVHSASRFSARFINRFMDHSSAANLQHA